MDVKSEQSCLLFRNYFCSYWVNTDFNIRICDHVIGIHKLFFYIRNQEIEKSMEFNYVTNFGFQDIKGRFVMPQLFLFVLLIYFKILMAYIKVTCLCVWSLQSRYPLNWYGSPLQWPIGTRSLVSLTHKVSLTQVDHIEKFWILKIVKQNIILLKRAS